MPVSKIPGAGISGGSVTVSQTAPDNSLVINSSGNVGIGTSSPSYKLQVANNYGFFSGANYGVLLGESNCLIVGDSGTTNAANMIFYTSNTEKMRLTTGGQLGLGVTPSGWGGGFKVLQIGRGSYSADGISNLQVSMNAYYNGSDWKYISANRASNMYLDLSGSVNIRTTNTVGTIDGSISWTDGPYVAAGGTSWTSSSDENLKNITGEIDDALNKVTQLRAAKFTWKADAENTPQVGLIAQDLQNVLPECVVVPEEKNDSQGNPKFLGVNYDQVVPLLVAAIKELKAELDATKAEVQALKGAN